MVFDPRIHHRRSIRLKGWDYSTPWWYYVTMCAYQRRCIFGSVADGKVVLTEIGKIVEEEWLRTPVVRPDVELDHYVIMPNHLHGIVIIKNSHGGTTRRVVPDGKPHLDPGTLGAIIGQIKSVVTKRVITIGEPRGGHVWQRGYYEHIIRNDADLFRIREYISLNPMKWSLDEENPL